MRRAGPAPYERTMLRTIGYWLGVALLIIGGATAVAELLAIAQGAPSRVSLGFIWFQIHPNSLVGFQALIEKQVALWLWPPIQFVLALPAWLILVPLGALLVFACRAGSRT